MRERDFRNNLKDALLQTGQFDDVSLVGLPETDAGAPASDSQLAAIQPGSTQFRSGWDAAPGGGRWFTCQLLVTILARREDPQLCDELAEQLLNAVRNAADGQILVYGFNEPQKTMCTGWRWLPRTAPERRIAITLTYDYIQDGWNAADTNP